MEKTLEDVRREAEEARQATLLVRQRQAEAASAREAIHQAELASQAADVVATQAAEAAIVQKDEAIATLLAYVDSLQ